METFISSSCLLSKSQLSPLPADLLRGISQLKSWSTIIDQDAKWDLRGFLAFICGKYGYLSHLSSCCDLWLKVLSREKENSILTFALIFVVVVGMGAVLTVPPRPFWQLDEKQLDWGPAITAAPLQFLSCLHAQKLKDRKDGEILGRDFSLLSVTNSACFEITLELSSKWELLVITPYLFKGKLCLHVRWKMGHRHARKHMVSSQFKNTKPEGGGLFQVLLIGHLLMHAYIAT